jgi:hypothetical protein
MAKINIDLSQYDSVFYEAAMQRLVAAAGVVRDDARRILASKLKGKWKEHGVYMSYRSKAEGKMVPYTGSSWTAREKAAMVQTIRVSRSKDLSIKNVFVIAGNYNVWWAVQLEYGRGTWRGGAKPFLRPALKGADSRIIGILEGGAIGSKEIGYGDR